MECLSLTVDEVMHIRQVLVKAELEKFQQYKEIYNAMKKGKVCFHISYSICYIMCRIKRLKGWFRFLKWRCQRPMALVNMNANKGTIELCPLGQMIACVWL